MRGTRVVPLGWKSIEEIQRNLQFWRHERDIRHRSKCHHRPADRRENSRCVTPEYKVLPGINNKRRCASSPSYFRRRGKIHRRFLFTLSPISSSVGDEIVAGKNWLSSAGGNWCCQENGGRGKVGDSRFAYVVAAILGVSSVDFCHVEIPRHANFLTNCAAESVILKFSCSRTCTA